jgi:hypothetical protein
MGSKPDILNIRVLGSLIYKCLLKKDSKLDQVSEKGILIGFKSINYLIYILKKTAIRTIRDITILEDEEYLTKDSNIDDLLELDDKEKKRYISKTFYIYRGTAYLKPRNILKDIFFRIFYTALYPWQRYKRKRKRK